MHTGGKTQHRILSCYLISWSSTQQTRISSNWFGKTQRDPPPAPVRKHDWSHMTAHSWYIFSRPPHPHAHQQPLFPNHTYVSSFFYTSCHLVRKCVISSSRGSLWGEALWFCLSYIIIMSSSRSHTHMDARAQTYTEYTTVRCWVMCMRQRDVQARAWSAHKNTVILKQFYCIANSTIVQNKTWI